MDAHTMNLMIAALQWQIKYIDEELNEECKLMDEARESWLEGQKRGIKIAIDVLNTSEFLTKTE